MGVSKTLVEIAIYLKGEKLSTDDVTRLTKINPDMVAHLGEPKVAGNPRSAIYKTNIWCISVISKEGFSSCLVEFLARVKDAASLFKSFPGADEAYLDVFLAQTVDKDELGDAIDFAISDDALGELRKLNLPIFFSVCNVEST